MIPVTLFFGVIQEKLYSKIIHALQILDQSYGKKKKHTEVQIHNVKVLWIKYFILGEQQNKKIMTTALARTCKPGELLPIGLSDLNRYESTSYLKARQGYVYRYVSR